MLATRAAAMATTRRGVGLSSRGLVDYSKFVVPVSARRQPMPMRELYPLMKIPGMLNLGNGMPNPGCFPFLSLTVQARDAPTIELSGQELAQALQYGPTQGLPALVSWLSSHTALTHAPPEIEGGRELVVGCGSQDLLSKALDMLVGEGTTIMMEEPSYPGAIQAIKANGGDMVGVEGDHHGMLPSRLRQALQDAVAAGKQPRVLYVIPTGQNPTGSTMTTQRKQELYALACEYDLVVLEDDPYYYLRFNTDGDAPQSLLHLDTEGRVLRFDSFSKVLSSGLRLGWVNGPSALVSRLALHQQVAAMQASSLAQVITARLLEAWGEAGFAAHVAFVQSEYARRRDLLCALLDKHVGRELAEWHAPSAGMFVWVKCTGLADTHRMVKERGVERKVLFVPGSAFSVSGAPSNYVRISFSQATPEVMEQAIQRLGECLREEMAAQQR